MIYGADTLRIGAVLAVAIAMGFLAWLFVIRADTGGSGSAVKAGTGPVEASQSDLAALQDRLGYPIYWAGPRQDTKLELTRTEEGNVFVRYLNPGDEIGTKSKDFLTVGTYPFKDAYHALQVVGDQPGGIVEHTDDGALVVTNKDTPTSIYLAYRDEDVQVEVYDPDPAEGLKLAISGSIRPVD